MYTQWCNSEDRSEYNKARHNRGDGRQNVMRESADRI